MVLINVTAVELLGREPMTVYEGMVVTRNVQFQSIYSLLPTNIRNESGDPLPVVMLEDGKPTKIVANNYLVRIED